MTDWTGIAIRLAVYATLAPGFGIPLQSLAAGRSVARGPLVSLLLAGLAGSGLSLIALTAAMAGTAMVPVDRAMVGVVLGETAPGTAFIVRFVALGIAILVACRAGAIGRWRLAIVTAAAGVALCTLAWGGHGAMDEGRAGTVHLIADLVHLLAAGAWIGAIAAMLGWLLPGSGPRVDLVAAHGALHRFALTGSILVGLLVVSGMVSGGMILGVAGVTTLADTPYGRLLMAKLALFAVMLCMAALNRWVLSPGLNRALAAGRAEGMAGRLRWSLAVELAIGIAILAAVSWLGTLSPQG